MTTAEIARNRIGSGPVRVDRAMDIEKLRRKAVHAKQKQQCMQYIDPEAVLALIERLEAAERDAERLEWLEQQARQSRTGISFDWIPSVDREPSGYRFMRRHFIGEQAKTLRQAIDKVKEFA